MAGSEVKIVTAMALAERAGETTKGAERKVYGSFRLEAGESLLAGLVRNQIFLSAPCGGLGRCGKCRVRILKGCPEATPQDRKVFSPAMLEEGWRLACRAFPGDGEEVEILLPENIDRDFEVLSVEAPDRTKPRKEGAEGLSDGKTGSAAETYSVAVDLGTTTIAMVLLGAGGGSPVHTVTLINSQRKYGADVISRIQASVDGKREELRECVRKDLLEGFVRLTGKNGISPSQVGQVVIGGNTTMGHLLMGYSCEKLGVYPFVPVNIGFIEGNFTELIGACGCEARVVLLPGISAFVGGDIVSGLYAAEFDRKEEISLLIDLGTNGEMALGNRERILVTSAAAGPAFEGGNITWGTGSIPGAICSVQLQDGRAQVDTIRHMPPTGICGTGVVETVSELVREEIVDDTGALEEMYFEEGFPLAQTPEGREIVFTQQDVREIQLAKAAIRAGIETLILRYGIATDQVEKVYLAGGFGHKLDPGAAVSIGMLPGKLADRICGLGNSSLQGAMTYLQDPGARERISALLKVSEEIGLASDKDFQECYMNSMFFEKED